MVLDQFSVRNDSLRWDVSTSLADKVEPFNRIQESAETLEDTIATVVTNAILPMVPEEDEESVLIKHIDSTL